jgi:hypothetical protein
MTRTNGKEIAMGKPQSQQPAAPPPTKEGPRNFLVFLHKVGSGELERVCSEELWEMGKRLQEEAHMQGAAVKGELVLKLRFEADPELGSVTTTYEVRKRLPKPKRRTGFFWLTPEGNFTTAAPKGPQQDLPFGDVANVRGIPNDLNDAITGGDEDLNLED